MEKDFIFNWAILKIFVNFAQKVDGWGEQKRSQNFSWLGVGGQKRAKTFHGWGVGGQKRADNCL